MKAFLVLWAVLFVAACKPPVEPGPKPTPDPRGPPEGQDGSECVTSNNCDGGSCLPSVNGWQEGYCTTLDCREGCNGDDSVCISFLDGSSLCLDGCESTGDCRFGYVCREVDASATKVCFPGEADGPAAGRIGAACASDDDCGGAAECDTSFPGGYCVLQGCAGLCDEGSACVDDGDGVRCLDACLETRDCRVGYLCEEGICRPAEETPADVAFDVTATALGIDCEAAESLGEEDGTLLWSIPFEVSEAATTYTVVPLVRRGAVRPTALVTPSQRVDLVTDYRHHNVRAQEFQAFSQSGQGTQGAVSIDWPIMVPYAPQYADLLEPGAHAIEVSTNLDAPCLYVLETVEPGRSLDLDIYMVGTELDADAARTDGDLNEVLQRVEELLLLAGIGLGEVQFRDVPREIGERYAFVRDLREVKRVTAYGAPRDATRQGHLVVDVFLVEDIQIRDATVLGLSAGLPGAPGLHGNAGNGLVFTVADLGDDNDFVAHIMAHELGHYLGLRHTTEIVRGTGTDEEATIEALLGTTDPIEDTPFCDRLLQRLPTCPDVENLMFPAAPLGNLDPVLTASQGAVLESSALVKP